MQQFLVQQQAKAQLQQTISRLTDECWTKCIGNPGGQPA
jgi:import inner membrane translocase subunit TIM8